MSRFDLARQSSSAIAALHRLARARSRERWLRAAFWVWFSSVFAWLLPLGGWRATVRDPLSGLLVGGILALCGAALVALHRRVSRTEGIRAAVRHTKRPRPRVPTSHPRAGSPRSMSALRPARVAAILVVSLFITAPVLRAAFLDRPGSEAAWLLYPLAGAVLALRWRLRGVCATLATGAVAWGTVEGWWLGGSGFAEPAEQTVLSAGLLLTVLLPYVVAVLAPRAAADGQTAAGRGRRPALAGDDRFHSLVHNASDVTMVLDADGTRRYVSPSITRVLGYEPDDLVGGSFFSLVHPDDAARVLSFHLGCLNSPGGSPLIEFRCRDRHGAWRYLESFTNNLLDDPGVRGVVVSSRDITERKAFEEQLARQAFHDTLTGLPNRALFMDRLDRSFARASRERQLIAVMFVDLDRFKVVNDRLGHGAGDELLAAVARDLTRCLRPGDIVARFGGDEFTVLIERVHDVADAAALAERIIDALGRPFTISGHEVFATASIGIALSTPLHLKPADLLRDADVAAYQAKAAGGACHVVFGPHMNAGAVEQLDLEADLRHAIARDELLLYHQPEVIWRADVSSVSRRWCAGNTQRAASSRRPRKPA